MTAETAHLVPRRGLLLGAGAAVAGLGVLAAAPSADAAPASPSARAAGRAGAKPLSTTEPTPIGSAPIRGYNYRYRSFFDFTPETSNDTRKWGGYGTYTTAGGAMWTSMDIEPGARIRDVEWYVYNSQSAQPITALARVWTAGSGTLYTPAVDVTIPQNTAITAYRGSAASADYGPFKLGSRLYLGLYTADTTGNVQVNGVRVGFDTQNASTGALAVPVRAYDTRSLHDPFGAGATRTITLPSSAVPRGTTAVFAQFTALNNTTSGTLHAWPTGGTDGPMPALNFPGKTTVGNTILLPVSATGQINVTATAKTDVVIDIMGTVG